ncbi:DUF3144 domain-containing protein [Gilvimarinus agarilyticus]|uniref:DUF3144 domain-containing protein n=1 Tax=unclassified Gilvimarinus TaxID=2642066 RepID=UPI001C08AF47|nr:MULTISPECIES: DUF3144 domain-containing protein [unclassified Gilvimarinus]MBU2886342.1 DUF3144 domain-containing protein [Gilvimarinus agarilyticus]MDO6571028.1 DUF3144 domain-containing protein [Gilvimarinus sp. 2_MG-2023]MDO6747988.1 DUF3144 domain-containing protein [Gilvimarinus sp. 1_MG-2023]
MTETADETVYWDMVDTFIEQANELTDNAEPSMVSAAMLQALARYSAFLVANASVDRKEFTEEMESATSFLTNQFRDAVRDNLEDYRENYKVYMKVDDENQ